MRKKTKATPRPYRGTWPRSPAWSGHLPVTQGIVGSSPIGAAGPSMGRSFPLTINTRPMSDDSTIKELRYQVMLALYLPILLYSFSTFDLPDDTVAMEAEPVLVEGHVEDVGDAVDVGPEEDVGEPIDPDSLR